MKKILIKSFGNLPAGKKVTVIREISKCPIGIAIDKAKSNKPVEVALLDPNYDKYLIMLDAYKVEYSFVK